MNESQCAAVTYNDGPSLVIAGAGSGKDVYKRQDNYQLVILVQRQTFPFGTGNHFVVYGDSDALNQMCIRDRLNCLAKLIINYVRNQRL